MKKFLILLAFCWSLPAMAQQSAGQIFSHYQTALYQIRIIEKESNNKVSIGSGFQISADGTMVTNYHVVSQYVFHPDKYQMEFETNTGERGELTLLDVDIINDLAIVKHQADYQDHMQIAASLPAQGETIYSLGNPLDLGMIVVPGTYNGLKKKSFYQRMHFTGSINPGMSGGPVLNEGGQVVGVNVATGGNQLGFLVPLPKLQALVEGLSSLDSETNIRTRMNQQLTHNQQKMMARLLNEEWTMGKLGNAQTVSKLSDILPCWGNSNSQDPSARFISAGLTCRSNEVLYINHHFNTGRVEVQFEWTKSKELTDLQFYNMYEQSLANAGPGNSAGKNDVSDFVCEQDLVVNSQALHSKAILCTRAYKEFEGLYDVFYISAAIDKNDEGLLSHFTLSGVAQDNAMRFTEKFLEVMTWQ